MTDAKTRQAVALIASQIEAASSLLKFAADDLEGLIVRERSIFTNELSALLRHLQTQTAILDSNAVFLGHIDLVGNEGEEDLPDWSAA